MRLVLQRGVASEVYTSGVTVFAVHGDFFPQSTEGLNQIEWTNAFLFHNSNTVVVQGS